MNVFTCTTRLYKDAEQRFTKNGDSIVSFRGAVDSGFGQNKKSSWLKFNLWGKRGDALLPFLKDRAQVVVSGEWSNEEYTDKEGNKRTSAEVRVNELTLVGWKPEGQQAAQPRQQAPALPDDGFSDDIPF